MYRTYVVRLKPTARQRLALTEILAVSCELYNAALQERRDAWRLQRKRVTYQQQTVELTSIRHDDPEIAAFALDLLREPLRRVDRAFRGFFTRVKRGRAGYPRFRARDRYDSLAFHEPSIRDDRLQVPKVGRIRLRSHRSITGTPKSVVIRRSPGGKWRASVTTDVGPAPAKRAVSTAVGMDVGVSALATLSDGTVIENPRWLRQHEAVIATAQRRLGRAKRLSKNRRRRREELQRAYARMGNARRNYLHHVSKHLVQTYDLIAHEALNTAGLVRSRFGKSILDAAWSELVRQVTYKAEGAGTWVVPVNSKRTSQLCSQCGRLVPKDLSVRVHVCECGLTLGRDENAARNILARGVRVAGLLGPSEQPAVVEHPRRRPDGL